MEQNPATNHCPPCQLRARAGLFKLRAGASVCCGQGGPSVAGRYQGTLRAGGQRSSVKIDGRGRHILTRVVSCRRVYLFYPWSDGNFSSLPPNNLPPPFFFSFLFLFGVSLNFHQFSIFFQRIWKLCDNSLCE